PTLSIFSLPRPPPSSTLFPYTTLFRSGHRVRCRLKPAEGRRLPGSGRAELVLRRRELPRRIGRPTRRRPSGVAREERGQGRRQRSEEHTSELQSRGHLVCRLLLEKKKP